MFNALNGLGGGGLLDSKANSDANTALYSTFAVVGFLAGTITNAIGIRWSLSFGGIGYCVYVSSYVCFKYTNNYGYITFAGALLGVCAGILWSAQGAIMMSYPTEAEKGRFISWFWMIFNLGGVIGALVSQFVLCLHSRLLLTRVRSHSVRTSTRPRMAMCPSEPTSVSWS